MPNAEAAYRLVAEMTNPDRHRIARLMGLLPLRFGGRKAVPISSRVAPAAIRHRKNKTTPN